MPLTNFPNGISSFGVPVLAGGGQLGPVGDGIVLFVDPGNGSDGNPGTDPLKAKASMTAALAQCVASRGDVIIRLPGTETVTAPVVFNKQGVTVVAATYGHPPGVNGESFMTYNSSATGLSAAVINDPVRLVGLGFAASDVSEEALLIDCEEQGGFNGGFNSIENCRFPLWNGNLACSVRMIGGALNHVIGCVFDGVFGDYAEAAIILQGDTGGFTSFYPQIIGNRFHRLGAAIPAIKFATGSAPDEVHIVGNYLGSEGVLLDNNSEASDGICADNYLGVTAAATGGTAVTNKTNMSIKFSGNHYTDA